MEKVYKEDVDEAIDLRKKEFITNNLPTLHFNDIQFWNRFNRDIRILPDTISSPVFNHIFEQTFYDTLASEWEPYRLSYTKVKIQQKPMVLMIRQNLVESDDLIATLGNFYVGILFVLLLAIFLVARFTSKYLWRTFYDTLHKIEHFEIETHNIPIFQKSNITEFQQLNHSLEQLISSNIQSYRSQKEFTENAAHELQTPIAVFQGKLDILLQRSDVNREQFVILSSINDTISRLNRLNKNLLLLSKIENHRNSDVNVFDLCELVKKPLDFFAEQAQAKKIEIDLILEKVIMTNIDIGLTEIMISNLFLNAISHNVSNGKIIIKLTNKALVFSNTGQIALKKDQLFNRFAKVNPSGKGNGLGLAIIKKIAELNHWSVDYNFQNNFHTFSILF